MTLYLKYRPKNLEELDLKDVSETLAKIVKSENIPHAFLFSGPKGTGKTSAARILAKIINCTAKDKPCDKCEQCLSITKGNNLDVIEMDAASNRGIDDIRNLKDAIKLSPTSGKKKIYIIDEAHMLTTEASNALLKTLEEPPEHIVFILATTNPEKLIDTIRSRATSVNFRKASIDELMNSLKRVVDGEKLKISETVLNKIAIKAGGAFRDAVKMLEQVSLEGEEKFNNSQVGEDEFISGLFEKNRKKSLDFVKKYVENGNDVGGLIKSILFKIQEELVAGNDKYIDLSLLLIDAISLMKNSPIEELPIEIAIIKWCGEDKSEIKETEKINDVPEVKFDNANSVNVDSSIWDSVLKAIRPVNATLEALLRSSKPISYNGNTLTLGVFYKFHKERLEESSHRKIVEEVTSKVLNSETRILCTLMDAPIIAPLTEDKDKDIIRVAEEIFS